MTRASKQTEQSLLGTILHTADSTLADTRSPYWRIEGRLKASHFYGESHRHIWRAIEEVAQETGEVWPGGVNAALGRMDQEHGRLEDGKYVEIELADYASPSAEAVPSLAAQLREMAQIREIRQTCIRAAHSIDDGATVHDVSTMVSSALQPDDPSVQGVALGEVIREYKDRLMSPDEAVRYETGVSPFDQALHGGLVPGRFYLVGARPKMGKTKVVVRMVWELVDRHDFTVDFWYTDGRKADIGREFLAAESGVNTKILAAASNSSDGGAYFQKRHNEETAERVARAIGKLKDTIGDQIRIFPVSSPHVDDIRGQARSRASQTDRYCCVLDYIQNATAGRSDERENIRDASRAMCDIRSELNAIAIALAQFNRKATHSSDGPKSWHLKGSGQLEQDVNHLITWHRPHFESDDGDDELAEFKHVLSKHEEPRVSTIRAELGTLSFTRYGGRSYGSSA